MRSRAFRLIWPGLLVVAAAATSQDANACPRCEAGQTARAEVWNDDFIANLSIALLPFVIVGAVCVGAERIGRRDNAP